MNIIVDFYLDRSFEMIRIVLWNDFCSNYHFIMEHLLIAILSLIRRLMTKNFLKNLSQILIYFVKYSHPSSLQAFRNSLKCQLQRKKYDFLGFQLLDLVHPMFIILC